MATGIELIRKLERDLSDRVNAAVARGESASRSNSPADLAHSVARELQKIGVKPDRRKLLDQYGRRRPELTSTADLLARQNP